MCRILHRHPVPKAGKDMGFLKKLLGKEKSHEEWLAAHPGKHSTSAPPPEASKEEAAATRARMEGELASDGRKLRGE